MSDTDESIGQRTLSSALATLSLAQAFMLDELYRIAPDAAGRVAEQLKGYVSHIEQRHGAESIDAATTRITVQMLLRTIEGENQ